jgi:protein-S-isoprenylcysteine O-methyltransferase Ste14
VEGWQEQQREREQRLDRQRQRFERPVLSLLLIVALLGTAASFVAAQTVGAFWMNFATSLLLAAGLAWRLWQLSKRADSPDGNGTST